MKTANECRAMVMLLNGGADMRTHPDEPIARPWWYGNKGHVITCEVWRDDPDLPGAPLRDRDYFDADTMEPLSRKEVSRRIQEYDDYMDEAQRAHDEQKEYEAWKAKHGR